jgi:hypothetical protein
MQIRSVTKGEILAKSGKDLVKIFFVFEGSMKYVQITKI